MSSEAWLIRKAKKGDTKAYGELIQLHKDYFYRNAFCYVKNVDLAGEFLYSAGIISGRAGRYAVRRKDRELFLQRSRERTENGDPCD